MRTRALLLLTTALCAGTAAAQVARRAAPAPIASVIHGSVRYAATYDRQEGSFAAAVEARGEAQGDRLLWKAPLYRIASRDTQERYVKRLLREEAGLVALRQDGKFFLLPAAALAVQAPRQAVELPEPQVPVDEARLDRGPLILVSTSTGRRAPCTALHSVKTWSGSSTAFRCVPIPTSSKPSRSGSRTPVLAARPGASSAPTGGRGSGTVRAAVASAGPA